MTSPDPLDLKAEATNSPPRRTREDQREDTRNRLLTATIEVLIKKGYSAFRIADAAAAAGVSRGAQSHHFRTKDALIEAAIATVFDSELGASRVAAATIEDGDILRGAAAHSAEFLKSDQYYITMHMLISARDNPPLVEKIRSISSHNRDRIEKPWIDGLQQVGLDPDEAEDVFWVLSGVLRDVAIRRRLSEDQGRDERVIALTLAMLDEYVKARSSTN